MEDKRWKGFVVDILDEISNQLNYTFEIIALEETKWLNSSFADMDSQWEDAIFMVNNGVFLQFIFAAFNI
jgi:hypothetical protein